jgi:uncharacterized protein YndB with AHSA1/START domain
VKEVIEVPTIEKTVTIDAPLEKIFDYLEEPSHLPEIWPSLYEVKDVKTLPSGGHAFKWFYNFAGFKAEGTTETFEFVPYQRIIDKAKGDIESVFTWTVHGQNGTTTVKFMAEYGFPKKFTSSDEKFVLRRNEFEAQTLLQNLKAKFEV